MTYENGVQFLGQFNNGRLTDNQGQIFFENGDVLTGKFFNGRIDGPIRLELNGGGLYEGDYKNGKYDG